MFPTSVTTLGRDQRRTGCVKTTTIEGMYVAVKMKNPLFLRYKPSNIYEIFHGKYMVFIHG